MRSLILKCKNSAKRACKSLDNNAEQLNISFHIKYFAQLKKRTSFVIEEMCCFCIGVVLKLENCSNYSPTPNDKAREARTPAFSSAFTNSDLIKNFCFCDFMPIYVVNKPIKPDCFYFEEVINPTVLHPVQSSHALTTLTLVRW